ncbi:hypothetical protein P7C70_g1163, partial [Phenoliferia sp. Uapishka_3]
MTATRRKSANVPRSAEIVDLSVKGSGSQPAEDLKPALEKTPPFRNTRSSTKRPASFVGDGSDEPADTNNRSRNQRVKLEDRPRTSGRMVERPDANGIFRLKTAEFFDWMFERHLLFLRRMEDPNPGKTKPWINNKLMLTMKSCNVFRELDYATQFLYQNIINNPQNDRSLENLFFQVALFRGFSKPRTWILLCEELERKKLGPPTTSLFQSNFTDFVKALANIQTEGKKMKPKQALATGEYQIPSCRKEEKARGMSEGEAKLRNVQDLMRGRDKEVKEMDTKGKEAEGVPLWRRLERLSDAGMAFEETKKFNSYGDFMGYQLLLDFNYIKGFDFDFSSWVGSGPGSEAGLGLLFSKSHPASNFDQMEALRLRSLSHWESIAKDHSKFSVSGSPLPDLAFGPDGLDGEITGPTLPGTSRGIGIVEIEHALCEFKKYEDARKSGTKKQLCAGRFLYKGIQSGIRKPVTLDLPAKYKLVGKSSVKP